MNNVGWSRVKEQQFANDLRELLRTYGIAYLANFYAGEINGAFEMAGQYYFWLPGAHDSANADEVIKQSLVDVALNNNDKSMFDQVLNPHCTDCDVKLDESSMMRCDGCGKPMCASCYRIGLGRCVECDYPNEGRRYI